MPVPGYPLATNKGNATNSIDDHPQHHNALATGVNVLSDAADSLDTRVDAVEAKLPGAYQFHVKNYGAVGDNVANDRAAIQSAINAAVAYGLANNYYAEVWFEPKTYYLGSAAPQQRQGTEQGGWGQYAMLALPEVLQTGRKLILVFKGTTGADGMLHWLQQTPQQAGTVLRANPTGLGLVTINGINNIPPSILGGPLHSVGNTWTNIYTVIDGLNFMTPKNCGIIGCDLKECANARIITMGAITEATVNGAGGNANIGSPPLTNDLSMGLRMPEFGNNDLSIIESYSCEGWYYGLAPGDHFHINRMALIYNSVGIYIGGTGVYEHGLTISSLSIEASQIAGIQVSNTAGFSIPIHVSAMHVETSAGYEIDDPANCLKGVIHWHSVPTTNNLQPNVNGAKGLKIVNERMPCGPFVAGGQYPAGAPAVPATGQNTTTRIYRDAAVSIAPNGATITQVRIEGITQGATGGTFFVPSGSSIGLTYTGGPPTWTWVLL